MTVHAKAVRPRHGPKSHDQFFGTGFIVISPSTLPAAQRCLSEVDQRPSPSKTHGVVSAISHWFYFNIAHLNFDFAVLTNKIKEVNKQ